MASKNYDYTTSPTAGDTAVPLTHFSLFTGIGGIDLAAEWAGFTTVAQCDNAKYPTKILEKHWPQVPRWKEIHHVTATAFKKQTGLHTVTLISGGFPCQPFSQAGKRRGRADHRDLWPEMFRVIVELRPSWVLGENVAGFVPMELDRTLTDLAGAGYQTRAFVFPACAVGAPHQRMRCFVVGHSHHDGSSAAEFSGSIAAPSGNHTQGANTPRLSAGTGGRAMCQPMADTGSIRCLESDSFHTNANGVGFNSASEPARRYEPSQPVQHRQTAPDSDHQRQQGLWATWEQISNTRCRQGPPEGNCHGQDWWSIEPDVGRVAHGVPHRVDRIKCLGNAVVPQQVYPILRAIAAIERRGDYGK